MLGPHMDILLLVHIDAAFDIAPSPHLEISYSSCSRKVVLYFSGSVCSSIGLVAIFTWLTSDPSCTQCFN